MKLLSAAYVVSCLALGLGSALADDGGLGKKKGGGGGQSGGGQSTGSGGEKPKGGPGLGRTDPPRGGGGDRAGGGIGSGGSRGGSGGGTGGSTSGGGTGSSGGGGLSSGGGRGGSGGGTTGGTGGGRSDDNSRGGRGTRGDRDNRGIGGGQSGGSGGTTGGSGGTQSGGSGGTISGGGGGVSSGSGASGGGIGRDRPNRGGPGSIGPKPAEQLPGFGDNVLSKKRSRSGQVTYGTVNNGRARGDRSEPITIGRAPIDLRGGSLSNQIRREDRVRITNGHIRFGYYHYDRRWCDDYFYYPYYSFDPWQGNCVYSPWYYYASLPPYLTFTRIICINNYAWSPFVGVDYRWSRPSNDRWGSGNYSSLDYAIDDLQIAFEENDRRSAERLIPRNGNIAILMDGQYSYSLNPDDFYDMFMDAVDNTRTRSYRIVDVKRTANVARVRAEHDYEDPWGRITRVYHYIRLEYERGAYVIREFGTSDSRW
jgi:hypothetical protein